MTSLVEGFPAFANSPFKSLVASALCFIPKAMAYGEDIWGKSLFQVLDSSWGLYFCIANYPDLSALNNKFKNYISCFFYVRHLGRACVVKSSAPCDITWENVVVFTWQMGSIARYTVSSVICPVAWEGRLEGCLSWNWQSL